MKRAIVTASLLTLIAMPLCASQSAAQTPPQAAQANSEFVKTEGEVIRVDKDGKKLTIRHRQIRNPEMPAMSMVFQVKDPAMLDAVKFMDKVRFSAESIGGMLTVTEIEALK